MALIKIRTEIKAPIKLCFDLSRSIDLHQISVEQTNEEAIEGRVEGLINLHEYVKWRAKHLGFLQTMTVGITKMESPTYFQDKIISGAFKSFCHDHYFQQGDQGITQMDDEIYFQSPVGFIGNFVDWVFMKKYLSQLLMNRNEVIKAFAESNKWHAVPGMKKGY